MDNFVGKFDRNFLVAAFVPSLAFVSIALFVFTPIIPQEVLDQLQATLAPLDQPALLLLLLTLILGFSMYSLNIYIYKIMEGYYFLARFPIFVRFQRRKVAKSYLEIKVLETLIERLTNAAGNEKQISILKQHLYQRSARYQFSHPLSLKLIMPTRFGNALRAMEVYPRERYKMDSVLLWPRLIHVMPKSYYTKLDQSNNSLAFLINCSILSLGLAIASGLAAGYQYLLLRLAQIGKTKLVYFISINTESSEMVKYEQNTYLYVIGVAIMMGLFTLFYRASVPIAIQYGNLVRGAFDLFRWHLIQAMHLETPGKYSDERTMWDNLSMFIGHGPLNDEMIPFQYDGDEDDDELEIVGLEKNQIEEENLKTEGATEFSEEE